MNELKYKFFHKETGIMSKVYTIEELAEGRYSESFNIKDCEKLQYSMRKDKNGIEVYCGDVLRRTYLREEYIKEVRFGNEKVSDNEDYGKNEVSGFYLFNIGDPSVGFEHMDRIEEYEIIGNIYNKKIGESK